MASLCRRAELDHITCRKSGGKVRVEFQYRYQQDLGIGMRDGTVDIAGRAKFAQAPLIENGDPVGQCLDHRKVVADENVAGAVVTPQIVKQFQNCRLY